MYINKDKSEQENLLALVNKGKTKKLTLADVEFSTPRAVGTSPFDRSDPNHLPIAHNTVVTVTAKTTSLLYKDHADFYYRRKELGNQWLLLTGSYDIKYDDSTFSEFNEENVKEYINQRINLIPSSVTFNITFTGEKARATITAKATSLCYLGTLVINISKKDAERVPLPTVIVDNDPGTGFFYDTSKEVATVVKGRGFIYSGKPES